MCNSAELPKKDCIVVHSESIGRDTHFSLKGAVADIVSRYSAGEQPTMVIGERQWKLPLEILRTVHALSLSWSEPVDIRGIRNFTLNAMLAADKCAAALDAEKFLAASE